MKSFHDRVWLLFSIWFSCGIILVGFSLLPPWLEWANAVFLFLSGTYAAFYLWHVLPRGRWIIPLIFFGSILIESFGTHTGLLFGAYTYMSDFGPMVFGVPITMGPAWLSVMGASLAFSKLFNFRYRTLLLVPLFTVWLDLAIDPVAAIKQYWIWHETGMYYGIPGQNFFGWYVTSLFFSWFIAKYEEPSTDHRLEHNNQLLFLMLHLLFGVTACSNGLHGVFLITLSSIAVYLLRHRRQRTVN